MLAPSTAHAARSLPLPAMPMHPASSPVTSAEASSGLHEEEEQLVHGAASPSSPPPAATRAGGGGGVGIIRCQDCWLLAKAGCPNRRCCFCCSSRGLVCPAHHHVVPAVVPTRKRPRALHSVVASRTTSSSVGQPTAAERFAREVSMDAVVFRRVRLGPHNEEVAYHATVTIGGHVFRGVLYDVGPRGRRMSSASTTDTAGSSDESSRSTAGGGGLDLTLRL